MSQVEQIRNVAVDHHSEVASVFEDYYRDMARSRFTNAFTYGRFKVDVALDAEVKKLAPGSSILDVGCGTGAYLARYKASGFEVAGIEPAPNMRAVAIRDNPGVQILDAVATSLPFPDGKFDLVFAIEVYRYLHLDDVRKSLGELVRVLKPGGRMFFTMVNRYALDGFYVLQRARQVLRRTSADTRNPHCEFFSPSELRAEMERAGVNDIEIYGRMLAGLRLAYKVPFIGGALAQRLDAVDDFVHRLDAATPFAGHLIAAGSKR
ncbi:MAG: methyltransferase domain-containing protein [Archangium sp.]|nr:methyltransferase domain-containing protein [Archangium sp.]